MIRDRIKKDLEKVVRELGLTSKVEVTRSQKSNFGDFSTNLVLKISDDLNQSPMESAKFLTDSLKNQAYLEKLEVASPGFINFFIKKQIWQKEVAEVLKLADKYGSNKLGQNRRARVEFVSANPTGPLHFGNGRGGPIGDVIASVLEFCGFKVLREYIDNDRGNQVNELGKTLAVRAGLIKAGEEDLAYRGTYTQELASKIKPKIGRLSNLDKNQISQKMGEAAVKMLFEAIIEDCGALGIKFDHIVHESELQKKIPPILSLLRKKKLLVDKEGAAWFAPRNEFLEDKDAVVVKSDGSYTYFASDIVYHKEKFESGYDLVIDVFGSNTIGHVPKLKALAKTLGFKLENFKVVLYQFVRIKRGDQIVKMSKRAGNFVTVREVLDEVGRDATRFFILMHDAATHMDFDLELARQKSSKNPVYYVQYAHARIASILKKSKTTNYQLLFELLESERPRSRRPQSRRPTTDYTLLNTSYELDLIKQISRLPELVEDISRNFAVHALTAYARELADSFHKFYENCPVLSATEEQKKARLALCLATKIALANTLSLVGVSAPEKM